MWMWNTILLEWQKIYDTVRVFLLKISETDGTLKENSPTVGKIQK